MEMEQVLPIVTGRWRWWGRIRRTKAARAHVLCSYASGAANTTAATPARQPIQVPETAQHTGSVDKICNCKIVYFPWATELLGLFELCKNSQRTKTGKRNLVWFWFSFSFYLKFFKSFWVFSSGFFSPLTTCGGALMVNFNIDQLSHNKLIRRYNKL